MDIISLNANKIVRHYIEDGMTRHERVLEVINEQLNNIDNPLDKIKFINIILEGNKVRYDTHLTTCTNNVDCPQNIAHETLSYFMLQELGRLGVKINEDTFTIDEKNIADEKLDIILKELEKLKDGQQVIYDDLIEEINQLKELYFLGKKNWQQLLGAKCLDMLASGVISETVSKEIASNIKSSWTHLIDG